jgi:hypothetical protein
MRLCSRDHCLKAMPSTKWNLYLISVLVVGEVYEPKASFKDQAHRAWMVGRPSRWEINPSIAFFSGSV